MFVNIIYAHEPSGLCESNKSLVTSTLAVEKHTTNDLLKQKHPKNPTQIHTQ